MAPKILRIAGWHLEPIYRCAFCGNNPATVDVEYEVDSGDGDTFRDVAPACDVCSPPGSVPDPVADAFERAFKALKEKDVAAD